MQFDIDTFQVVGKSNNRMDNNIMNKWISVKDSLPDDCQEVIFFYRIDEHKKDVVSGHMKNGIWHICYLYNSLPLGPMVDVTHWQPMLEFPDD